jgi:hypothetical protein
MEYGGLLSRPTQLQVGEYKAKPKPEHRIGDLVLHLLGTDLSGQYRVRLADITERQQRFQVIPFLV